MQRLVERCEVGSLKVARDLVYKHHLMLEAGRGERLYGDEGSGFVHRLRYGKRVWYPVRRKANGSDEYITVTYLDEGQVFWSMVDRDKRPARG